MKKSTIRTSAVPPGRRNFFRKLFSGVVASASALQFTHSSTRSMTTNLDPEPYLTEIRIFSGTYAPSGWMFCSGQLLDIATHPALFSLLGTNFGGNGTTNFALPDLRERFVLGTDNSSYFVGNTGGAASVVLTTTEIPSHTHTVNVHSGSGTSANPAGKTFATNSEGIAQYAASPSVSLNNGTIVAAGGGGAHNNMPPYLMLNYIICVDGQFPSDSSSHDMSGRYISEIMLIGTNFAPAEWMKCEGQLLPISEYESLFILIGTTYGGDGEETFAIPDLRGRIPLGQKSSQYIVGDTGGSTEVTLASGQLPTHSHNVAARSGLATSSDPSSNVPASNLEGVRQFASGADATMPTSTVGNAGSGQPHNNMPPYCAMTYCIAIDGTSPGPS